jgi:hypothetical protein
VSKINKQKVVPTIILKKVEDKYFSFRNQTPESVEKPKTLITAKILLHIKIM